MHKITTHYTFRGVEEMQIERPAKLGQMHLRASHLGPLFALLSHRIVFTKNKCLSLKRCLVVP